jgi:hypothetical protein
MDRVCLLIIAGCLVALVTGFALIHPERDASVSIVALKARGVQ